MWYELSELGSSLPTHYQVWQRADLESEWVPVDEPWLWDISYGVNFQVSGREGRIYAQASSTTLEFWPLLTKYEDATVTTITAPGGATIGWWEHFYNWTLLKTNDGNLHLYYNGSFVETVGSPVNPATWDYATIRFGWLVVSEEGAGDAMFWRLNDDGTADYHSTLNVTGLNDATPVGSSHVIHNGHELLQLANDVWTDRGTQQHLKDEFDDGYSWQGVAHRMIWLYKSSGTPKWKLGEVY